MRITVLVEADDAFATAFSRVLWRNGHHVLRVRSAADAVAGDSADLVLLDVGAAGPAVCARLRAAGGTGIIVLGAGFTERDRVACLRAGADDCLATPVGFGELLARVEAVLRRSAPPPSAELRCGGLHLDVGRHEASVGGRVLPLSRKEFHLLRLLAERPHEVRSRERLLAEVWRSSGEAGSRTLDVHIARIRSKLGGYAAIDTVRGVGYQLGELLTGGYALNDAAVTDTSR